MRLTLLLFYLLFSFFLSSCKKYRPAEEAFFIKSSNVSVTTNSLQGSGSHKITDLGLYVNGQFMGSYPAGNSMPVISKGENVTINVQAGIKNNGISETRIFWPFYETLTLDTFVPTGQTVDVPIKFKYSSGVTFTWTENFDSGSGYSVVKSSISDSNFTVVDKPDSFEGRSLKMGLSGNAMLAQIESVGAGFTVPKGSPNVYLEVDYKCNEEVGVGLIDDLQQLRAAIFLNKSANWNKIYIALGAIANTPSYSPHFKVYFRMVKHDDNPNPVFYLDNIKLVYL